MQISNRYPADCAVCGARVDAHAGVATGSRRNGWTITHKPSRWTGSPVSGGYVGGCPDKTPDTTNTLITAEVTA